ncbi:type I 3-dehydroquinate dehydratase, partial [Staphylococcus pseudintermedius]
MVQQIVALPVTFELLVTYRTSQQGGKGVLSTDGYLQLLRQLASLDKIDFIDIEWEPDQDVRRQVVEAIHQGGKVSIA